jgi:hypothetical protein
MVNAAQPSRITAPSGKDRQEDGWIWIEASDTGSGIAPGT